MDKPEILINTQTAFFFEKILEKPEGIWESLNNELGGVFDQTPIILPVPRDQKLMEVPVVQMLSSSGVYSCNISRARIDFFIAGEGEQAFNVKEEEMINMSSKLFNFLKKDPGIKRIGFVSRFFIKEEKQDEILKNILNKKFIDLHTEGEESAFVESYVKYVQKIKVLNLDVNNFTTIEKYFANIPSAGENIKGVLVTRDFNTIPELNLVSQDGFEVSAFMREGATKFHLREIKELLWPEPVV